MDKISPIKENILYFIEKQGITKVDFCEKTGISYANMKGKGLFSEIGGTQIGKILSVYSEISPEWLLTGQGSMLRESKTKSTETHKTLTQTSSKSTDFECEDTNKTAPVQEKYENIVPFYSDVSSIGGTNELSANMNGVSRSEMKINVGDWFQGVSFVIHHYGDSMTEYPSGCMLALREIFEKQKIVWGKNYVIETSEYRITKRLQRGKSEEFVRAYSSNEETYQDGTPIHEPIDIHIDDITRLALVLGYVVKEQSSGGIYNTRI